MRPILLELPMPITTARLVIRPPMPGDGPAVHAAVAESQADLAPWMPWATKHASVEDSEDFARRAYAAWTLREDMTLGLFERESGRWVGGTGLHRANWQVPRFETGYWVTKSYSGKGYITEGVSAVCQYAFATMKAQRLEIRCDSDNTKSAAVARRLGFVMEARLEKDEQKLGGGLRDTLIFRRLDSRGLPDVRAKR